MEIILILGFTVLWIALHRIEMVLMTIAKNQVEQAKGVAAVIAAIERNAH